jgi:hypothetical protein
MMIPFRFVPHLVAHRLVTLHSGKAAISSHQLLDLLGAVFEAWLEYGTRVAERCRSMALVGDCRLRLVLSECKVGFFVLQLRFLWSCMHLIQICWKSY